MLPLSGIKHIDSAFSIIVEFSYPTSDIQWLYILAKAIICISE
jgi:hypothetical protein